MTRTYYRGYYSDRANFAAETEKAICLSYYTGGYLGNVRNIWFPKSQVVFENGVNDAGLSSLLIPLWLFKSKNVNPDNFEEVRFDSDVIKVK